MMDDCLEELSFRDGNKSLEFSDLTDPAALCVGIEMENYDDRITWYLDAEEAVKVRDWLNAVIERAA